VSPEVCQTQLQARDAIASVTRTFRHIVKGWLVTSDRDARRDGVVTMTRPATIAQTLV
jgi:hypothetical protein